MSDSSDDTRRMRGRRRHFNMPAVKSAVVFAMGGLVGLGSALTGLGAQAAFAPMLGWMLGFSVEKAHATALRYSVFVCFAMLAGCAAAQHMQGLHGAAEIVSFHAVALGILLFLAATVGALLTGRWTPGASEIAARRFYQSVGVLIGVAVVFLARRISSFNLEHFGYGQSLPALCGLGLVAGALSQVMALPSGALLVPGLYFLGGFDAAQSVALSLLVVGVAAILPSWGYSRRGLVDAYYGTSAAAGGLLGGFAGGMTVPQASNALLLTLCAAVVMYFCARELAGLAGGVSNKEPGSE